MDTTSKLIPVQNAITDTAPESQSAEFLKEMEIDVLARTLWGEARGEGSTGMEAVASVILNRVEVAKRRGHYWWGNKIIQVCQKPYQFSCWNKQDPNFKKLIAVTADDMHFATAQRVARYWGLSKTRPAGPPIIIVWPFCRNGPKTRNPRHGSAIIFFTD